MIKFSYKCEARIRRMMDEGSMDVSHITDLRGVKFSVQDAHGLQGEQIIRFPTYTPLERVQDARDVLFRAILDGKVMSMDHLRALGNSLKKVVREKNAADGLRDARTKKGDERIAARAAAKEKRLKMARPKTQEKKGAVAQ